MSIRNYIDACETIANNQKLPYRIVDWAEQLFNRLVSNDMSTSILLEDLLLIEIYIEDNQYGLSRVDRVLSRKQPKPLTEPDDMIE
jgi:hypothetical protein